MSEEKNQTGANGDKPGDSGKKNIADLFKMLAVEEPKPDEHKEMAKYKFWKTQPVTKFDEDVKQQGPVDKPKTVADVRTEPLPLLKQFEWVTLDLENSKDITDLHNLLYDHYVEDHDSSFRFAYSVDFFKWALTPPGWNKDWHVGVRVKDTGKLVGFISGVPARLSVREHSFDSVEINFLCVHKQLRNKRLAPILIKEVTRRINLTNIWQALYTSGTIIPTPISTCRYTHRALNWEKLYDVGFSALPPDSTKAQMIAKNAIASSTKTAGLRKMVTADVDQVLELYSRFQSRYDLAQPMTEEELTHWLLGDQSLCADKQVIHTYVVESKGKITDFFSFYVLPFTVLNNALYDNLGVAYLYYYASEAGLDKPRFDEEGSKALAKRLHTLIGDALVLAKRLGVDVFNALTSQDNVLFLDDLKFGHGDGFLNYYLFNWRTFPISGGIIQDSKEYDLVHRSGVGVVML